MTNKMAALINEPINAMIGIITMAIPADMLAPNKDSIATITRNDRHNDNEYYWCRVAAASLHLTIYLSRSRIPHL